MNRSRQLLLTLDYEIFGNGSGDVRQHMVEPTERMARICERHEVPLTIFFEAEEYLAFRRNARDLEQALGYDPARLIREQVRSLVSRGHDLQLHLHPEWVNATFEHGRWILNRSKSTVDSLFDTVEETDCYIAERKACLEDIAGKSVVAYRAGAFSAQPSAKLLHALAANRILIDSSVVKGLVHRGEYVSLDYNNVPSGKMMWRVNRDVTLEDESGPIWEVPIYSVMRRRFHQLTWRRIRAKFSRNVPKERQSEMMDQLGLRKGPLSLFKLLFKPVPIKLDYHNLAPHTILRWIKAAPKGQFPEMFVLIGHSKEHIDDYPFQELLRLIASDSDLKVAGFDEAARTLCSVRSPVELAEATIA
jgi:hypothetical protein